MKKETGNVGDLMTAGLCVLALVVVIFSYLDSAQLIQDKLQVAQLARKYILRMETVGMLSAEDEAVLSRELIDLGVTDFRLDGTTTRAVGYGEEIVLEIRGKLDGSHAFTERRVSTAKH